MNEQDIFLLQKPTDFYLLRKIKIIMLSHQFPIQINICIGIKPFKQKACA